MVGQPDVQVRKIKEGEHKGKYKVSINGFDYYDTRKNNLKKGSKDQIAMWMLDTNYDNRSLYPRQVFSLFQETKMVGKKLKRTLKSEIDENLIGKFKGTESIPFKSEIIKKLQSKLLMTVESKVLS